MIGLGAVASVAIGMAGTFMAQPPGARWTELGETEERIIYIDLGSRRRAGQLVTVWQRGRYFEPQEGGTVIYDDRARYDCGRRTSTLLESIERREDESVIASVTLPEDQLETLSLQPGTVGHDILQRVCQAG